MSSKKYLLAVALGLCTFGVQLGAKVGPGHDVQSWTGRYVSGDDSMAISVNDLGQVEGFYVRGSAFGEISGTLVDGAIVGSWMESSSAAVCSSKKRGYSNWGVAQASLDSEGLLTLQLGVCEGGGSGTVSWTLQRKE